MRNCGIGDHEVAVGEVGREMPAEPETDGVPTAKVVDLGERPRQPLGWIEVGKRHPGALSGEPSRDSHAATETA